MKYRFSAVSAAVIVLAACQGVQHTTPSGRPEVTISSPVADVKTVFVGSLTNMGYTLTRDTDFQVVMEKPVDNVMANVLLSSEYDPTVEARITGTFLNLGESTRVTADLGIVRNGGSAFEQVMNVNNSKDSAGVQSFLADIKTGLETGQTVSQTITNVSARTISQRVGTK